MPRISNADRTVTAPHRLLPVARILKGARPAQVHSVADRRAARHMLALLKSGQDVRQRKVRRIGAAIRAGKFENSLKLDIAIDRMLEEIRVG